MSDLSSIIREPIVRVGVAILLPGGPEPGMLLFGKRSAKNKHGGGTWAFPGGHVEFGEDPEVTAARELREETGMVLHPSCFSVYAPCPYVNTHFKETHKQYITLYMTAKPPIQAPRVMEPDKCDCWEYFKIRNLPSPLFAPIVPRKLWAYYNYD